jgi:hypothetical protein
MAKHKAYLLIGPDVAGVEELHEELTARADDLAKAGLSVPGVTAADIFHGSVEIRRTHKAEDLRRKDVEGTWAAICRTAEKCRGDVVIGLDQYAAASGDQIALLLDGLAAFHTHVVVTLTGESPSEQLRLDDLIGPWSDQVRPERFHVLSLDEGATLDDVLTEVSTLARLERAAHLERRIDKLTRKRKKLRKQLARIPAA